MSVGSVGRRTEVITQQIESQSRYSSQPPAMAKKIARFALGTFVVMAIANVPTVQGGFALMALCMSLCTGATAGAFAPACFAACCATTIAPTP